MNIYFNHSLTASSTALEIDPFLKPNFLLAFSRSFCSNSSDSTICILPTLTSYALN